MIYIHLTDDYKNLEELKKHYRELTKKYHPDVNSQGLEAMQKINVEFESLFNIVKFQSNYKSDNTTEETPREFINIIKNIINLDLTIEIIGSWIWVSGNTKEHKELLKANSFKWAAKKLMWYYNPDGSYKKKSKKQLSINEIKNIYGSTEIKQGQGSKNISIA